jgi:hypothetical protein
MTHSDYLMALNLAYWRAHDAGYTGLARAFAELLIEARNET